LTQINTFIDALKCWRRAAIPKITSYSELVFQLAYDIGCRWESGSELKEVNDDEYLRMIDEQVYYLVNEQHLSEDLLTGALVTATAKYIHRPLAERDADIAYLEKMLAEADEIDALLHKLVQLKDPAFEATVLTELQHWQQITKNMQA